MRKHKTWSPSINIYRVDLYSKEYDVCQSFYFLFLRRARAFLKDHSKEIDKQNLIWTLGGEPLWLW